jgi:hypothetical protein
MRVLEGGSGDSKRFKELLDEQFDWPTPYLFKFIVPSKQLAALEGLLEGYDLETRASSQGNYVSVSLSPVMESADSVIELYNKVGEIEGLLAL